jgi:hypothetical protein
MTPEVKALMAAADALADAVHRLVAATDHWNEAQDQEAFDLLGAALLQLFATASAYRAAREAITAAGADGRGIAG